MSAFFIFGNVSENQLPVTFPNNPSFFLPALVVWGYKRQRGQLITRRFLGPAPPAVGQEVAGIELRHQVALVAMS